MTKNSDVAPACVVRDGSMLAEVLQLATTLVYEIGERAYDALQREEAAMLVVRRSRWAA